MVKTSIYFALICYKFSFLFAHVTGVGMTICILRSGQGRTPLKRLGDAIGSSSHIGVMMQRNMFFILIKSEPFSMDCFGWAEPTSRAMQRLIDWYDLFPELSWPLRLLSDSSGSEWSWPLQSVRVVGLQYFQNIQPLFDLSWLFAFEIFNTYIHKCLWTSKYIVAIGFVRLSVF